MFSASPNFQLMLSPTFQASSRGVPPPPHLVQKVFLSCRDLWVNLSLSLYLVSTAKTCSSLVLSGRIKMIKAFCFCPKDPLRSSRGSPHQVSCFTIKSELKIANLKLPSQSSPYILPGISTLNQSGPAHRFQRDDKC